MTADFRAIHPSGEILSARLWFGVEVEGSRSGLGTAFIAGELSALEVARLRSVPVQQWFFTEAFDAWTWYLTTLDSFRPGLVTAGIMAEDAEEFLKLRDRILKHVRVIVRVFDAPWADGLRATDQVSVGVPYNMLTFEAQAGVSTKPFQYEKDRQVCQE